MIFETFDDYIFLKDNQKQFSIKNWILEKRYSHTKKNFKSRS